MKRIFAITLSLVLLLTALPLVGVAESRDSACHCDEPEIVRQTGGFGIRLRASAPSIHMIKADIETELNPMVGTEQQSEELVKYLLSEFDEDPRGLWSTNLFGKSIYELVNEGLHSKLDHMPEDARERFGETLAKVINEGASGVICILL